MINCHHHQLAYVNGLPPLTAGIKKSPHDFMVDEQLSFSLEGEGTHDYLLIRKVQLNTEDVVSRLSKHAQVKPVAIGYAGLKDKNAITSQWFSVNLAGKKQPDWQLMNDDQLQVIEVQKHSRKLKRGAIKSNRFQLTLRNFEGARDDLEHRINRIRQHGVPNYFGEQRFGRSDANLRKAAKLFAGEINVKNHHQRGLYLSAARSYLFNQVLSKRVAEGTWSTVLAGEACILDGSNSFFVPEGVVTASIEEPVDGADVAPCPDTSPETLMQRLEHWDIHPSGPLWGAGELPTLAAVNAMEEQVASTFSSLSDGLVRAGLKQQRRSLRMQVHALQWEMTGSDVFLTFDLASGSYATVVLREIVQGTG